MGMLYYNVTKLIVIHDNSDVEMATNDNMNVVVDCSGVESVVTDTDDYSMLEYCDNVMDTYTTGVNADLVDDYTTKVKHDSCQNYSNTLVDDKTEMCLYYTEDVNGDIDTLSEETESCVSSVSIDNDNCCNDNEKTCWGNDIAIVDTGIERKQTDVDLCKLNEDDQSINRENRASSISNAQYNFICNYCGNKCESVAEINIHLISHTQTYQDKGKHVFTCSICKTDWDVLSKLRDHMFVHTRSMCHKCIYCPERFLHQDELSKHIVQLHTENNSDRRTNATRNRKETDIVVVNGTDTDIDYKLPTSSKENNYINKETRTQLRHWLTGEGHVHTGVVPVTYSSTTNSGTADIASTTNTRTADISPTTDSHTTDISPTTDSHTADISPTTDSHTADLSSTTDSHRADIAPTTDSHTADITPTTYSHTADITPTTDSRKADITPTTGSHTADITPTTDSHTADITPTTDSHTADITPTTDSHTADITPTTDSHTADITPTTDSHTADITPTTDTHTADIEYTTDSHTADITPSTDRPAYTEITKLFAVDVNTRLNSEIVAIDDIPTLNTGLRKAQSDQENASISKESLVDDVAPYESGLCNEVISTVDSRWLESASEQHLKSPCNSCKYCGVKINSMAEMSIHINTHKKIVQGRVKYMYKCNICGIGCDGRSRLREHMYVHTRKGPYMCMYCPKSFLRRFMLNIHTTDCHRKLCNTGGINATGIHKGKYITQMNNSDTNIKHQLLILEKHDQENEGITNSTRLTAITPSTPDIHVRTHGEVIHKEVHTSTEVASEQPIESFRKNMNTCNYCGDTFDTVAKFSFHLKTHEKKDQAKYMYRCNICETDCDVYSKLKNHMLNVHSNIIGEFKCMKCPKGFGQRHKLDAHMVQMHPEHNTDKNLKDVNWDRNSESMENCVNTKFEKSLNKSEGLTRGQVVQENDSCTSITEEGVFVDNYMKRFSLEIETACTCCGDRFGSLSTLRIHLKTHVTKCYGQFQFAYQCNICKKTFENKRFMTNHRQVHYGDICVSYTGNTNSLFLCGFCQKVVKNITELTKHLQTHISIIRYFQCEVCSRTFADHKSLTRHKDDHDKDNKAEDNTATSSNSSSCTCDWCGKVFDCGLFLEQHILGHLRIKPYSCQICHAQFYTSSKLKKHSYRHTGLGVFRCVRCIKSFGCSYSLRCHMMRTHGETEFTCNFCPKTFLDSQALNKHLVDHRRMQNVCKICGKLCRQKYKLRIHMASHSDARPIQCKECRKTYKTDKALQKHSHIHRPRSDVAIACEICGKSYRRAYIRQHMKFHLTKKRFHCDKCSKTFTLKHHLRDHLLSHDETRNHVCDICGYKFKMAHHMRSHMKLHASNAGE